MKADYHVHTEFSDDSNHRCEAIVLEAIELKLDELCFTDHVDYGVKPDWHEEITRFWHGKPIINVNYPAFFKEYERVHALYKDKITLKKGFEFGVQMHTIDKFNTLFNTYPLDFVILSIHQVDDQEFWTQEFQKGKTQDEFQQRYYDELYQVVRTFENYSVLGHIDLIRRYDEYGAYPFEKIQDKLTLILKEVIQQGKGIEVNTSSFRYGLNDLMPSSEILKLYLELGGTILTIGSDSHQSEHLAKHIEDVKLQLKEMGFKHFCTYESMKPIFHDL